MEQELITENGEELGITKGQGKLLRNLGLIYYCNDDGQNHIAVGKTWEDVEDVIWRKCK